MSDYGASFTSVRAISRSIHLNRKRLMPRAAQTEISIRFIVEEPVASAAYSLQDRKGRPVDAAVSKDGSPLTFDFPNPNMARSSRPLDINRQLLPPHQSAQPAASSGCHTR